jgi:hypothetical protein
LSGVPELNVDLTMIVEISFVSSLLGAIDGWDDQGVAKNAFGNVDSTPDSRALFLSPQVF